MPIRFRCSSCERLLSIARRKAGTPVTCPDCKSESIVPAEELATAQTQTELPPPGDNRVKKPAKRRAGGSSSLAEASPEFPAPPNSLPLFERPDFEALLNPSGASMPELVESGPKSALPRAATKSASQPQLAIPEPMDEPDVVLVSRGNLTMVAVVMVVLVGLAFAAGYIIAAVTMSKG